MKKLLALLLALLLPGCAAAETYALSISVEVDDAIFPWYAKQSLRGYSELSAEDLDTLATVAAKVLDGTGLDIAVQADAMSLRMNLAGKELLSVKLHTTDDAVFLTSPMLSGYALKDDQDAPGSATQTFTELFDGEKQLDVCASMQKAFDSWMADITPATSSGVFNGDAYEGGTQCTTWILSDMDVAALTSALATVELRVLLNQLLTSLSLDAEDLFAQFDAANEQVADEDRFLYILRWVTDEAGEFVGASLTVLEEQSQVATVSIGLTQKNIKVVIGLGLKEQNYWWEFTGKKSQLDNITYLSGDSREWIADKAESFSYVSATNAPVANYMLRGTLTKSGSRYLWDGNICVGNEAYFDYVCSSNGTYYPQTGAVECSICLGDAPYEPLRLNIRYGLADTIDMLDSSLEICSISDPADASLYQELMDKFAASVMARMIKLLPMDLIMTLNQFSFPQ